MLAKLRWALECQLERDAGLSFIEYHALARLSEEPGPCLRMSELAALTNASLSRLSHLAKRLESSGFIRREPDPTDGRFTRAVLTDTGYAKLVASAPAHVAAVRTLVIDEFQPRELNRLRNAAERIVACDRGLRVGSGVDVSGPVDLKDVSDKEQVPDTASGPVLVVSDSRMAEVGALQVRRALPNRGRRTVGAWCFVDHGGPIEVTDIERPDIGPHPTWDSKP